MRRGSPELRERPSSWSGPLARRLLLPRRPPSSGRRDAAATVTARGRPGDGGSATWPRRSHGAEGCGRSRVAAAVATTEAIPGDEVGERRGRVVRRSRSAQPQWVGCGGRLGARLQEQTPHQPGVTWQRGPDIHNCLTNPNPISVYFCNFFQSPGFLSSPAPSLPSRPLALLLTQRFLLQFEVSFR